MHPLHSVPLTSPCEWHLGRSATQVKVNNRTAAPFPILRVSPFTVLTLHGIVFPTEVGFIGLL